MMKKQDLDRMQEEQPFAPLSSLIYEYYKDAITKFYILPDTKLKESRIAQDLDISRSPVDKAMDMLSEEGLVVKDHHKAPRVVSADLHDCVDVCQARMSIEGEAAYLAAKQISKEQLDELKQVERNYVELLKKNDFIRAAQIDEQFHCLIVKASGNRYLLDLYNNISQRALRYRCYLQHLIGESNTFVQLYTRTKSHDVIIKALEEGMSSVAREEMRIDINSNIDMYIMCVKPNAI
ncbi:MAG: GntR family transcriptional regulator [Firmicutes bacterium]|nr:GntR family transcriptional regulator [Bacillota bacterium]